MMKNRLSEEIELTNQRCRTYCRQKMKIRLAFNLAFSHVWAHEREESTAANLDRSEV